MATYRVAFDGKWQENFDDVGSALEWAHEVAETWRIVHVVKRQGLSLGLVAVFPESKAEEGRRLWEMRHAGSWSGGSG